MAWQVTDASLTTVANPKWQVVETDLDGEQPPEWQVVGVSFSGLAAVTLTATPEPYEPGATVGINASTSTGAPAGTVDSWSVAAMTNGIKAPTLVREVGACRFVAPSSAHGTQVTIEFNSGGSSAYISVNILRAAELIGGRPARLWIYRTEAVA